jgi:hypothetical protein
MIAMIALTVAAPYAVAAMAGYGATAAGVAAAAAATGMGTLAFTASVVAVTLVGTALINAIAPIRPPAAPTDPGSSEAQLMVTGGANRGNPYGSIPVVLGRVKLTPPLGAINFISYQNERDTYLTMLLAWGYGPLDVDYQTLKIGDVSINDFVLSKFADGTNKLITLDRKTQVLSSTEALFDSIYGNDTYQAVKNIVLVCDGNPEGVSTTTYVNGQYIPPGSEGEGGYYLQEPVTTTVYPDPGIWYPAAGSGACSQVQVALHFPQGLRKVKTKGDGAGESYVTSVKLGLEIKIGSGNWQTWKTLTLGTSVKKDAFTVTETYDVPNQTAQVRVRRETGDNVEDNPDWRYYHEVVFLSATFVSNEKPAKDPKNCKIAKTALQIKANEQLSNQIEGINAVVQTWCLSWTGTAWIDAKTNNPADLFRYVLQHPANPQRVLDSEVATKIDLIGLQYWHGYCATKGFEFNSVMASQRSVLDTLRDICAAGRASPALIDGKWTVVIDEPKPQVIQHFTPHNSWGFEATKFLPKLPDGLRVTYYDEAQDYQEAEIIVYANNKSQDNAELFEAISLPGVTKSSSVIDHARWHMAQAQLRKERYIINSDIEYIVCNRGDRVKVAHDVPMWGLASGRVKNQINNSIFELTEYVPVTQDKEYTIRFRNSNGSSTERVVKKSFQILEAKRINGIVTVTLTSSHPISIEDSVSITSDILGINSSSALIVETTSNTISYAIPGADIASTQATGTVGLNSGLYTKIQTTQGVFTDQAAFDDLFLYGEYQQEAQDLIILSIEPTTNKSARITLVDYGVTDTYNIFDDYLTLTAETVFETQISLPAKELVNSFTPSQKPSISLVRSDDSTAEEISPGTYAYVLKISYTNAIDLPTGTQGVECQYDYSNSVDSSNYRSVVVDFKSNSISIRGILASEVYKLRLRYVSKDGRTGTWTDWLTHTVSGKLFNYTSVVSLSAKRVRSYLEVIPALTVVPSDFKHFEVRVFKDSGTGDFWINTSTSIIKITTTSTARFDLKQFATPRLSVEGTKYRIACRTVDSVGNYNDTSLLSDYTIFSIAP